MSDASAIDQLQATLALQKSAFLLDQYPSLEERTARLHKIAGMLMSNRQAIRDALTADFGNHPQGASDVIETLGPAGRAMWVASQLPEWMKDEPRYIDPQLYGNAQAYMTREPKGVIGNLVPFNFPFDIGVGSAVEILAAGNRLIIKPSEFTPACGALLKKLFNATFPADLVEVIIGGTDLGIAFSQAKFDHLMYTGSPGVGKLVMREAAANLTPVTLELGGKCPAILTKGSVTARNVDTIVATKMLKNGQMCVTIDYAMVQKDEVDTFISLAKAYVAGLNGYSRSADCCGIITLRHFERIQALLAEARAAGANVIELEENGHTDPVKRTMPLFVILDPSPTLRVSLEEIFGPILVVRTYDTLENAIAHVNGDERPLAVYAFGDDAAQTDLIAKNTKSGGLTINACALHAALPSLGFGGIGNSGMGCHHGVDGWREFSNPKGTVVRGTEPDMVAAFGPPYSTALAIADHAFAQAGM